MQSLDFKERKAQIREQAHANRKEQLNKDELSLQICDTFMSLPEYAAAQAASAAGTYRVWLCRGPCEVSDTAAAPWTWDLSSGEAERFPRQDVNSHFISGTEGSLTLPRLEYWHYREAKGWHDELTQERNALHFGDVYALQLAHFCAVIEGIEEPLCAASDATRSLEATLAVRDAAKSGRPVLLGA